MMKSIWFVLVVVLSICACDGYRILVAFPTPSRSHGLLGDPMVKHLLDAGHEVTYVTPFPKENADPKLHQIDVSDNIKEFSENTLHIKKLMDKEMNFVDIGIISGMMRNVAKSTLKNTNTQKLLRDPNQKFDVVISHWLFQELYSSFAVVFDCPLIWFSSVEPHWVILNLVDGPLNPAYSADYVSYTAPPLSFVERVKELWVQIEGMAERNFFHYYREEEIYQELVAPILIERGKPVPSFDAVRFNASLVLGNSHFALGDAHSLPASYVHIGGFHIAEDVKPLPEDLKSIVDNAENGVIYFSMGTLVKGATLPVELQKGILKVFSSLKQTVIWKFENVLPDLPKNVHIVHWAPQQSLLAHPNVILFITHGGLLSVTESIHYGVPIVTIPVFVDQFANGDRAQKKGYGKRVDLSYTMFEDLNITINEILSNPKYTEKVKEISRAYHNNPLKPKDSLKFWVNHVIETHGAPHLRSPGQQLRLYQRLYLDLIGLIFFIVIVFILIAKRIFCSSNNKKKEKHS